MSKQWTVSEVVTLYSNKVNDYNILVDEFNQQIDEIEALTAERDLLKTNYEALSQEVATLRRGGSGLPCSAISAA